MEKNDCDNKFIDGIHLLQLLPLFGCLIIFSCIVVFFGFYVSWLIFPILFVGIAWWVLSSFIYSRRTIFYINTLPERNSNSSHHAIIIAHVKNPQNGIFSLRDYMSGEDVILEEFQKKSLEVNYRVYEVTQTEQVIHLLLDPKITHVWIFGHGQRNKLRLTDRILCYYEVKDALPKVFIGQYHCNTLFGMSFADYNKPRYQDVSRAVRIDPLTRFSVSKMINELKSDKML